MNHACVPTSFLSWELKPGHLPAANLRATEGVAEGGAVTISYIPLTGGF